MIARTSFASYVRASEQAELFRVRPQRRDHERDVLREIDAEHLDAGLHLGTLDLELRSEGEWSGWTVKVRNTEGKHFLSVPVRSVDQLAA